MKRPHGMTPGAFDAYIRACFYAHINPRRIMQTMGNAPASAGYHARDGVINIDGEEIEYCAAVDLRTLDLNARQIKALLKELARQGFAAWYRFEGSFKNNQHIHAIFAGLKMKPQLYNQVRAFLENRNGLKSNRAEKFFTASAALDEPIRLALEANNRQDLKI